MSLLGVIKSISIGLLIGWFGLAAFAFVFANRMIFPQPPSSYQDSDLILKIPYGQEGLVFSGLYLPHPGNSRVIFYHAGNGEDLGRIQSRLESLRKEGFAVFAWDYPGYGTSPGRPNEARVFAAAEAGLNWLRNEKGYAPENIILYGRSLGGGPAVYLAAREDFAGLILESTFTSTFRVLTRVRILPWDIFDNLSRIDQIRCPVLFIHGDRDFTVPFSHGPTLHRKAPEPKFNHWIEGGGHNNLPEEFGQDYWTGFRRFVKDL